MEKGLHNIFTPCFSFCCGTKRRFRYRQKKVKWILATDRCSLLSPSKDKPPMSWEGWGAEEKQPERLITALLVIIFDTTSYGSNYHHYGL